MDEEEPLWVQRIGGERSLVWWILGAWLLALIVGLATGIIGPGEWPGGYVRPPN